MTFEKLASFRTEVDLFWIQTLAEATFEYLNRKSFFPVQVYAPSKLWLDGGIIQDFAIEGEFI